MKLLDDGYSEIEESSAYNYDTSSEAESVRSAESTAASSAKKRKSFKPSIKKRVQLTFSNLTVKTIPQRKKFLCCQYGQYTKSKTILESVSGTIVPGQFVAILGSSGN